MEISEVVFPSGGVGVGVSASFPDTHAGIGIRMSFAGAKGARRSAGFGDIEAVGGVLRSSGSVPNESDDRIASGSCGRGLAFASASLSLRFSFKANQSGSSSWCFGLRPTRASRTFTISANSSPPFHWEMKSVMSS